MAISILLGEMDFLIRTGLEAIVRGRPDWKLSQPGRQQSWLQALHSGEPDLLIVDHQALDKNYQPVTQFVESCNPVSKVLIISEDTDPVQIQKLIDSGIKGFLTKNCSQDEILQAIDTINSGDRFFCQKIVDIVFSTNNKKNTHPALDELSQREMEILQLIGKGLTSKEISNQLFISIHTVNSHRKNLLKKLDMKSPTQLIVFALENL